MVYIKIIKNTPPPHPQKKNKNKTKQYSIVGAAVVEKYQRLLLYHGKWTGGRGLCEQGTVIGAGYSRAIQ